MMVSIILFAFFLSPFWSSLAFNPRTNPMSRIIGGNIAQPGQFPYQVGLQMKVANITQLGTCGGSLISANYVLSAAHCVAVSRMEHIEVHLGAHELKNVNEGHLVVIVPKENLIPHEDYNEFTVANDIALLKLTVSVEFNDKIQPIVLPSRTDNALNLEDKYLIASGWGRYSDDLPNLSDLLRFTKISVLNQKICKHYYNMYFIPSTMFCTYTGLGQGPCNSDSGGPLTYTDDKSQHTFIAGIVSYGGRNCVDIGFPTVYTRVASYLDWIAEHSDIQIKS